MLTKKSIKKCIAFGLLIEASISFVSCDIEVTSNEADLYGNKATLERVKTNIEEAKVLSSITILNENVIWLSQLTIEKEIKFSIKSMSNKLKKQHKEIRKEMEEIANNKFILLPKKLDTKEVDALYVLEDDVFVKVYLDKVHTLIEKEITQLNYLSSITNDLDFKVFTVRTLDRLDHSLNQINKNTKRESLTN